jgi:hypothetical protein
MALAVYVDSVMSDNAPEMVWITGKNKIFRLGNSLL